MARKDKRTTPRFADCATTRLRHSLATNLIDGLPQKVPQTIAKTLETTSLLAQRLCEANCPNKLKFELARKGPCKGATSQGKPSGCKSATLSQKLTTSNGQSIASSISEKSEEARDTPKGKAACRPLGKSTMKYRTSSSSTPQTAEGKEMNCKTSHAKRVVVLSSHGDAPQLRTLSNLKNGEGVSGRII